jgi:2,3-bisphosphoglycerate-independent phosphoglycerate mutase
MKYIVLIGDGMADRPLKELGNKTCLQHARTPNMDWLAREGEAGKARTIPKGFDPGSDVANLSILGYDPKKYYSGRAPFEAAFRGITLKPADVAFRCNLVTLSAGKGAGLTSAVMQDYSAGHISTAESRKIINDVQKKFGDGTISFYPGMSYRHLMVWRGGKEKVNCTPPHDISGRRVSGYLPSGAGGDVLRGLMEKTAEYLVLHPVNRKRMRSRLHPANSLWFWGQGKQLTIPAYAKKYKLRGALISAVDLTKGLGICAGFHVLNVKGATGYLDTNYPGKARAALRALKTHDFVYVHVEAPDEAGHIGDVRAKIQAIEDFDEKVVGTILKGLHRFSECRVLLMPDHFTPVRVRTHTAEPVPFLIYRKGSHRRRSWAKPRSYSENICRMKNIRVFEKGYKLMDYFIHSE